MATPEEKVDAVAKSAEAVMTKENLNAADANLNDEEAAVDQVPDSAANQAEAAGWADDGSLDIDLEDNHAVDIEENEHKDKEVAETKPPNTKDIDPKVPDKEQVAP